MLITLIAGIPIWFIWFIVWQRCRQRLTEEQRKKLYVARTNRIVRLLVAGAPEIVVANEARMIAAAVHGGPWRAIWHWFRNQTVSDIVSSPLNVQIWWWIFRGLTEEEVIAKLNKRTDGGERKWK